MKIKHIKISNILSFKYCEDLDKCEAIEFEAQNNGNSDLHILIGPNGAGKSNFLEILNQIFKKVLFIPCHILPNFSKLQNGEELLPTEKILHRGRRKTVSKC